MFSSFLFWGQTVLAGLALLTTVALTLQFGPPRDTVRALGLAFMGTLSLMLLTDALSWWGFFVIFHYPDIYGVYLGIMGFAWPAFVWLGVLDHPSQLQRKIMWRLPIVGALLGHALGSNVTIFVFLIGWVAGVVIIATHYEKQRYILRILATQVLVSIVYSGFLRAGHFTAAQICVAVWIVFTHRIVNAFLIKNHVRNTLGVRPEGASV
jgi:hypothetical protein